MKDFIGWSASILLSFLIVFIIGKAPVCNNTKNKELEVELYRLCLSELKGMRNSGGGNYTTNEDEDLDEALHQCQISATEISTIRTCK